MQSILTTMMMIITFVITCGERNRGAVKISGVMLIPRQGSLQSRNSRRWSQPPPTRTATVLWRNRTRYWRPRTPNYKRTTTNDAMLSALGFCTMHCTASLWLTGATMTLHCAFNVSVAASAAKPISHFQSSAKRRHCCCLRWIIITACKRNLQKTHIMTWKKWYMKYSKKYSDN